MIGLNAAILCCAFVNLAAIKCRSGGHQKSRLQYDRWLFGLYGSRCSNVNTSAYHKLTRPRETICEIPSELVENSCDPFIIASCYTALIADESIGSIEFIWGCGITHHDLLGNYSAPAFTQFCTWDMCNDVLGKDKCHCDNCTELEKFCPHAVNPNCPDEGFPEIATTTIATKVPISSEPAALLLQSNVFRWAFYAVCFFCLLMYKNEIQ